MFTTSKSSETRQTNTANARKIDSTAAFALIGAILFWSIGPVFIKLLTSHIDHWTQNLLRYSAACLFWLPILIYAAVKKRIEPDLWRKAIYPAAANIVMQTFWAAAFYYIDPAFMDLLLKSSFIWIAAFSLFFFADERCLLKSKKFWLGLTMSLVGVLGVMFYKENFTVTKNLTGIIIALSAAFMWAVYTLCVRIIFKNTNSRIAFSIVSIYTVAGLAPLALIFGRLSRCLTMGAAPWSYVLISGVTAIALSHVLYYVSIRRIGATIPALVLLATPFTILLASHIVLGESLNLLQILFGIVLLTGSALTIRARQNLRQPSW
jgi:drug/metabolite transporter (DMT)-like permease